MLRTARNLLTVLLEHVNTVVDQEALDRAFDRFIDEYGAPPPPK